MKRQGVESKYHQTPGDKIQILKPHGVKFNYPKF